LSTANPIQQVLDTEEQAEGVLLKAQQEADEIKSSAKKKAEMFLKKAEEEKKEEIGVQIQKEKESAQESFRTRSAEISRKIESMEVAARGKEETAVKKAVSAFVALFNAA
jgi:F0F1-type ATP synthase membrane subunit b/b'